MIISTDIFYRPDVLPVAQPTVSKHSRKHKALMPTMDKRSAVAEIRDSLATINMGRKLWGVLCPF